MAAIPHELRACLILGDFTVGEERLSRTLERFSVLREWLGIMMTGSGWQGELAWKRTRAVCAMRKMRKQLSAPGLLDLARGYFEQVKDPCVGRCEYTLADTLMSGLAMFLFKSSSMLQFERGCRGEAADPVLQHNLERLYGVAKVPSDSRLRRRLDGVSPEALRRVFGRVFEQARRHKALTGFHALGDYHLLAVDGTGPFASERVHCASCCEQRHREGRITYYHQVAGGGSGASFAIDRGAAGTGADREGGWPVEERLRTDGGEADAGPRATSASALETGGDAGCAGSHRPAVSPLSAT